MKRSKALQPKHILLIAGGAVVLIAAPITWLQSSSVGMSADLRAISELGVRIEKEKPPARPEANASPHYVDVASILAQDGPTAEAFKDLKQFDAYGVVKTTVIPAPWGAKVGTGSSGMGVQVHNGPLDEKVDPVRARHDLKILGPVLTIVDLASQKGVCKLEDEPFYWAGAGGYYPSSTYLCVELFVLKAVVDAETIGVDYDAGYDLAVASRILRQQANGESLDLDYRLNDAVSSFLSHLLALAERHPNDKQLIMQLETSAADLGEPKTIRSLVEESFPQAFASYQEAINDSDAYLPTHHIAHDSIFKGNPWITRMAAAQAVHKWRQIFEHMPKDPNDWEAIKKVLYDGQAELEKKWPAGSMIDPRLTPSRDYQSMVYAFQRFRLLREALHLFAYRAREGSFPDKLPRLGDDWIDPFSLKPLIYRREGEGFILYSVDQDRTDNGGDIAHRDTDFIQSWRDCGIRYAPRFARGGTLHKT